MFIIFLHTNCHMHNSNGLHIVTIKLKDINDFHIAAILLFYSLRKYYLKTLHIFPKSTTTHHFRTTQYAVIVSVPSIKLAHPLCSLLLVAKWKVWRGVSSNSIIFIPCSMKPLSSKAEMQWNTHYVHGCKCEHTYTLPAREHHKLTSEPPYMTIHDLYYLPSNNMWICCIHYRWWSCYMWSPSSELTL
jgi:hypothetical protein